MDIKDELKPESTSEIISLLEWLIYIKRIEELKSEIAEINNKLSQLDAKALMKSLTTDSMTMLKASIAQRYEKGRDRIASVKDLFTNGKSVLENYPVVLSTHSAPGRASTVTLSLTMSSWMKHHRYQSSPDG